MAQMVVLVAAHRLEMEIVVLVALVIRLLHLQVREIMAAAFLHRPTET
jgi:hypothetical protein